MKTRTLKTTKMTKILILRHIHKYFTAQEEQDDVEQKLEEKDSLMKEEEEDGCWQTIKYPIYSKRFALGKKKIFKDLYLK